LKWAAFVGVDRYDDLTGIFGLPNVSGVGVSFGAERIYDVLTAKQIFFPEHSAETTKVLFVNFGEKPKRHTVCRFWPISGKMESMPRFSPIQR
jgi:histidyl-tRNA synthetase